LIWRASHVATSEDNPGTVTHCAENEEAMGKVSEANRRLARALSDAFGGEFRVHAYIDDERRNSVDVLSCPDRPQRGVASFGTIGLSDHPIYRDGKEIDVRAELVGACAASFAELPNVLASCAFEVIKARRFAAPGVIFPEAFAQYQRGGALRHVMFVPPFLWEDLKPLRVGKKPVAWLLVVPISEAEMRLAIDEGPARLETLLEQREVDIYDPCRSSVL